SPLFLCEGLLPQRPVISAILAAVRPRHLKPGSCRALGFHASDADEPSPDSRRSGGKGVVEGSQPPVGAGADWSRWMKRCAACRRVYDRDAVVCPVDGSTLDDFSSDPRVGQVLAKRYRLVERLGSGSMGAVYLGVEL